MRASCSHLISCIALHCTALLERQEGINKQKNLWNCSTVYVLKRVPLLHLLTQIYRVAGYPCSEICEEERRVVSKPSSEKRLESALMLLLPSAVYSKWGPSKDWFATLLIVSKMMSELHDFSHDQQQRIAPFLSSSRCKLMHEYKPDL